MSIDRAIEQGSPLRDFVNDHPELEKLALSQERWTRIGLLVRSFDHLKASPNSFLG
jgi:hypothetical protein